VFLFLRSRIDWPEVGDPLGAYNLIHLLSIIVVYPCSVALGLACFRFFPRIMSGRRSRRAILTGSIAGILVWSGLGEWVLWTSERASSSMRGSAEGWMIVLVIITPFAISLTIAHAIGLLIPPGRPLKTVLPRRLGE
jgi:hypothetical protein